MFIWTERFGWFVISFFVVSAPLLLSPRDLSEVEFIIIEYAKYKHIPAMIIIDIFNT